MRADKREPAAGRRPQHGAFTFHVSARGLARVGQLRRNGGQHRGRSVIPADWGTASRPGRAVRYLTAEANIRQFLDIDTSIPTAGNTRRVA